MNISFDCKQDILSQIPSFNTPAYAVLRMSSYSGTKLSKDAKALRRSLYKGIISVHDTTYGLYTIVTSYSPITGLGHELFDGEPSRICQLQKTMIMLQIAEQLADIKSSNNDNDIHNYV